MLAITLSHKSITGKVFLFSVAIAAAFVLCINVIPLLVARENHKAELKVELEQYVQKINNELSQGKVFSSLSLYDDTRFMLIGKDAYVLYDSSIYDNLQDRYLLIPAVETALRGKECSGESYGKTDLSAYIAVPTNFGAIYAVKQNDMVSVHLSNLGRALLILSVVLALMVIFSATFGSKWFIHRIDTARDSISRVRGGAFGEQMEIKNDDEISKLLEEINALSEQILETENLRQTFVSDASHELRTPLSSIRLLMDSILQTENIDVETTREFMVDIGEQIDRLTRIAERLLTLTRLDGAKKLVFDQVDLKKTVESVVATLSSYADEAEVCIQAHLSDDCIFNGTADGAYQIVFNLVENAIKYNNTGGNVRVYLFNKEDKCCIIVDDDGIGIPEDAYKHIFERFYRVDKARSRSGKGGTGLGLSIVSKLIENFGGSIEVEPSVFGGTRFTVMLPRYYEEAWE